MNANSDTSAAPTRQIYLLLFLGAFAVRAAFLGWLDEPILFNKYPFFAEKLLSGNSLGERIADLSPFYLYWMTVFGYVSGLDWQMAKWIQAFLGAVVCLQVLALGHRAFNKEVGIFAALIYAVYGNLIVLESTLEPTTFVLLFNLAAVWCLQSAGASGNHPSHIHGFILAAGFLTGLSIVTKPTFLLFLPIASFWIVAMMVDGVPFLKKTAWAALFCVAAGLVVMPVTIRNFIELKDVVLVTADAGKVFYHGNGKGATALEWTGLADEGFSQEGGKEPDFAHVLYRRAAARASGRHMSPSESSSFWMRKALTEITDDPSAYFKRELDKLVLFFSDYEIHYIASAYKEYKASLDYPFIRYGIIAALGLMGMMLSLGSFRKRFLIYGTLGLYLVSGLLFIVQSRYRTPAVPYLCLFAGFTVVTVKERVVAGRWPSAAMIALAVGALFFLSHIGLVPGIRATDKWHTATKIYYQMGGRQNFSHKSYAAAIQDLDICIAMAPGFSPAYNLRGKARAILGQNEAALADFKTVIALSPNMPEGHKNLGLTYLLTGNPDMAKMHLLRALTLAPHDKKVTDALKDLR